MIAIATDAWPQPDSPTTAVGLARSIVSETPRTADLAGVRGVGDRQVLEPERRHQSLSEISRSPSAKRFSPTTREEIARAGKAATQGAMRIQLRAALTMPPRQGVGGRMPSPRKLSVPS